MIINLSGTTYLPASTRRQLDMGFVAMDDLINIKKIGDFEATIDTDWAVYSGHFHVGWIPKLKTIQKYIIDAQKENDPYKHDMQVKRYKITEKIREQLVLDHNRNNWSMWGKITSIRKTENGYSVSIWVEL